MELKVVHKFINRRNVTTHFFRCLHRLQTTAHKAHFLKLAGVALRLVYGLDSQRIGVQYLVGGRHTLPRQPMGPIHLPIQWVPVVLPTCREADHSPPSTAETKKDRGIPPLSPTSSWRGPQLIKRRDNAVYFGGKRACSPPDSSWFLNFPTFRR
jgi:hypothetical protein